MRPDRIFQSGIAACCAVFLAAGVSAGDDSRNRLGESVYQRHCLSCHGPEGRGDGPRSASFNPGVPDLSLIERSHGDFSLTRTELIISGANQGRATAREMRAFGRLFRRLYGGPSGEEMHLHAVTLYVASLQQRPEVVVHGDRCSWSDRPIRDPANAAILVLQDGQTRKFRSVRCLVLYMEARGEEGLAVLVTDRATGRTLPAGEARFVPARLTESTDSPLDFVAFGSRRKARRFARQEGCRVTDWAGVLESVLESEAAGHSLSATAGDRGHGSR
ncbi:MAG: c-type cytochrome [Acidobacteriota bacterium]|jgi:hypothetical protein